MDLNSLGKKVDEISVTISYKIIELFSAGLYSSPNKAFEELVCNSYDAFAKNVAVYIPQDLSTSNAFIWVWDDGEGLNSDELKNLWKIGSSNKRIDASRDNKRLQIGQFGIGKLATYILARKLTYLSKKDNKYLMVTMDYEHISRTDNPMETKNIILDEQEISEDEVNTLLGYYTKDNPINAKLTGSDSLNTWTLSILSDLKPKAYEIKIGRLRWILSTALPLNPEFKLYLNMAEVTSSKINCPIMKEWTIGKDDETANKIENVTAGEKEITINGNTEKKYCIDLPNLNNVYGTITLYQNSLVEGKASNLGRSHGIFLIIRGRLINLDDPLLGMEAFSHGTFNRLHIEVHADGLDDNLTSTREAVKDSFGLSQLKDYLKKKINNEVRKFYMESTSDAKDTKGISARLARTTYNTSKRPIKTFIQKIFDNEIFSPFLIEKPNEEDKEELLQSYDIESDEQIITNREIVATMSSSEPICKFNLKERLLKINMCHPFVANYILDNRNLVSLESIAITEILTEAHMYQLNIDEEDVHAIMKKRDDTLRELAAQDKIAIPSAMIDIRDSLSDPDGLEEAVAKALTALGFSATKIGGPGKPDGIAEAHLGYTPLAESKNYKVTFDAKSTQKTKIAAATAHLSGLKRHQTDYQADYCMEVAINYEGADDPESAISKESVIQKVTLLTAEDLMRILVLAVPKQISLTKLRELFETCYSPLQVKAWIDKVESENPEQPPYDTLIDIIYEKQSTDTETPSTDVVREILNTKLSTRYSRPQVTAWLETLQSLLPNLIKIDPGRYVSIECTPAVFKARATSIISNSSTPPEFRDIYKLLLKENLAK